jgi:DNA polymerase-3 subunit gamma/tau
MVYYRKYRPQTIAQLDLSDVREKFSHLLASSEIPHAFLFTGPKGLGKTSSARILAKAINCQERLKLKSQKSKSQVKNQNLEDGTGNEELNANNYQLKSDFEPCNECDICKAITNGSHVDVIEIDAASNRGIDEIRELRERVKYAPAELKKKIYIIDEVHMLTNEAFNALLKTLEEPPDHVLFILCTTEEWKIPTTVASRTFHVKFEKPTKEEIIRSLERIVEGENLIIEKNILEKIYKLSDGAFRNAAKSLEELAFQAENKQITTATLEAVFKTGSTDTLIADLLEQIHNNDMVSALKVVQAIATNGIDFKIVHEKLVEILHGQLISNMNAESEHTSFTVPQIKRLLELLNISYGQLRFSVLPQLPLEIAIMDYFVLSLPNTAGEEAIIKSKQPESEQVVAQPVTETVQPAPPKRGRPDILARLIESIKQKNHSVAGILRSCQLGDVDDTVLTIESRFTFHAERLMEKETKELLEKHASAILEKPIKVDIKIIV